MILELPTLYKKTSSGKIEQWTIRVDKIEDPGNFSLVDYVIVTEHGLLNGKLIKSEEHVRVGKNIGKANETTPMDQACSQAKSEWTAKLSRKGYCESLADAEAGKNSGAGGIRPMLAKKFTEHGHKLVYPIYGQPKLDGVRCIAMVEADGVTLWSREQKRFVSIPKIAAAIESMKFPVGTILDGELYNHELHDDFEKIASCVRKQYAASDDEQALIQYHIYDLPSQEGHFGVRTAKLHVMFPDVRPAALKLVETKLIRNEDELNEYFRHCRERKYEGCMARAQELQDKKGRKKEILDYEEGKRSEALLKVKEFDEGEFEIVGVREGVGNMAGCAIFDCKADNGNIFGAKLEGELANLRKYLNDESTWKNKKLTVQYQGLTNKEEVPRFPVGKAVRDYE